MKIIEALATLVVVLSFSLASPNDEPALDDTLYRYQLANDVWRVWYLRGGLEGFDKQQLNQDAQRISELTGWCVYLEEEDVASCIGDARVIAIQKKAWANGEIKNLTLVLARQI